MNRYYVECLTDGQKDVRQGDTPEAALQNLPEGSYYVSVLDDLGHFDVKRPPKVVITRVSGPPRMEPRITKPDSPHALTKAGPSNITTPCIFCKAQGIATERSHCLTHFPGKA